MQSTRNVSTTTMERPQIREPEFVNGRWRFKGTFIYIDALVADFQRAYDLLTVRAAYRAMGLSDAEVDAGLAFSFPETRSAAVSALSMALSLECVCGISQDVIAGFPDFETTCGACGRLWHIDGKLTPRLVENPRSGPS
jgi:hypothetical protein